MAYQRKTADILVVQGNYGYGFDDECTELTWKEVRARLKEYRANGTGVYRVVKRREKIDAQTLKNCGIITSLKQPT